MQPADVLNHQHNIARNTSIWMREMSMHPKERHVLRKQLPAVLPPHPPRLVDDNQIARAHDTVSDGRNARHVGLDRKKTRLDHPLISNVNYRTEISRRRFPLLTQILFDPFFVYAVDIRNYSPPRSYGIQYRPGYHLI
jgi:hypothetical protein